MRILIVSDLAPPVVMGGLENYIINLAKGLIEKGHDAHWLTSKLPNTKSEETYEGITIHRTYIPFSKNYQFPGRQLFPIAMLIKGIQLARKMDVVLVNTLTPGFLGWLIAKFSGKPSVLFCHEFYGDLWHSFGQNMFEKITYPFFEKFIAMGPYDIFLCPSEYSKKTLMRYGVEKEKIKVIPHGINPSEIPSQNYREKFNLGNKPIFSYLGRLSQKGTGQGKNLKGLLEATKYVIKEIPDAKLVLGGSGFKELQPYIKKLGIEDSVIYLGRIPDKETANFFKMSDVVVCPALSDGFCFLLAEASYCGIPVVGTNRGSHPERIENNENGILTNSDSLSIADGIIKILKDKSLSSNMGENGIEITKNLTWSKSVEKHLEVLQELISKYSK